MTTQICAETPFAGDFEGACAVPFYSTANEIYGVRPWCESPEKDAQDRYVATCAEQSRFSGCYMSEKDAIDWD